MGKGKSQSARPGGGAAVAARVAQYSRRAPAGAFGTDEGEHAHFTLDVEPDAMEQLEYLTGGYHEDTEGNALTRWMVDPTSENPRDHNLQPHDIALIFGAETGSQVSIRDVWAEDQAPLDGAPQAVEIEVLGPHEQYSLSWEIQPGNTFENESGRIEDTQEFHIRLTSAVAEPGHEAALYRAFQRVGYGMWNSDLTTFELPTDEDSMPLVEDHLGMDAGDTFYINNYDWHEQG